MRFSAAILLSLFVFLGADFAGAAEPAIPGNIPGQKHGLLELYKSARERDAALWASMARLEERRAEKTVARSNLLPRLDASGSFSRMDHTLTNYYDGEREGQFDAYSYGVTLRQPLFDGVSWFGLKSADVRIKSVLAEVLEAEQNLMLRVTELYYNVLKALKQEEIAQKERDRLHEVLRETEAKFGERMGDVVAVYEAKAALDSQDAKLVKARGDREVLENELSRLTGIQVSSSTLKDVVFFVPEGPRPAELNTWVEATLENHPVLIRVREDLTVAETDLKRAKAAYLPTANLVGSYSVNKGDFFLPELETERWLYGVEMRIPLFEGGRTAGGVSIAAARIKETKERLKGSEQELTKRVETAFLSLDLNVKLYKALKQQLESAEIQLKGVRKGREIGTRTQTDLINAEQAFFRAETELRSALYENIILGVRLKIASGTLNETEIVELERLLNS